MTKELDEDTIKPGAKWDNRADRDILRRERVRLVQNGTIIPASRGLAVPMAKDSSGKWWPNSNFVRN